MYYATKPHSFYGFHRSVTLMTIIKNINNSGGGTSISVFTLDRLSHVLFVTCYIVRPDYHILKTLYLQGFEVFSVSRLAQIKFYFYSSPLLPTSGFPSQLEKIFQGSLCIILP